MIVKNEEPVIRRCLESVHPLIDYWVIVDTGSMDRTMEIIRETLKHVPGELHEHPWVNFGYNRTQALEYALGSPAGGRPPKSDYIFVLDADHTVGFAEGFELPRLEADSYDIEIRYGSLAYPSKRLVRADLPWRYVGVLHEFIACDSARTEALLSGLWQVASHDGARARDPLTYRRDALVLEHGLLDEPDNSRYVFYLAQTYRDAGDPELALRNYARRAGMGGWTDEIWFSLYQIAAIKDGMGRPWPEVLQDYLTAYQCAGDRAEPLYRIGMHYQNKREFHLAHLFLGRALQLPVPHGNRLFVERAFCEYLIALEYAVSCYWLGNHAEAVSVNDRLLGSGRLPPGLVDQVKKNRQFSIDAVRG
jgi:glycosyltransferase involved in cell wall biosynthesis